MKKLSSLLVTGFLPFFLWSTVYGQFKLDSLWSTWSNKSISDSLRAAALYHYTWEKHLFNQPDSAHFFAQQLYDFGQETDKLDVMIRGLTVHGIASKVEGDIDKSVVYLKQCVDLSIKANSKRDIMISLGNLAVIYKNQGNYIQAIDCFMQSLKISEELGDKRSTSASYNNIGNIYKEQGDYDKALNYYKQSLAMSEDIGSTWGVTKSIMSIAMIFQQQKNFLKSIEYNERALSRLEKGDIKQDLAITLINLAISHTDNGAPSIALEYGLRGLKVAEEIGDKKGIAQAQNALGNVYGKQENFHKAIEYCQRALDLAETVGDPAVILDASKSLYKFQAALGNSDKALAMYERYIQSRDSIQSEENQRAILRQEYKYQYEKEALADSLEFAKKEAVKDLEIDKQQANISRQRIALTSTAGGLILILALAFSIYRGKKRSDELLLNILPEETAKELKKKGYADAKQFEQVTVLFTDFKGFTKISERMPPSDLVAAIHDCFKAFDRIIGKYEIEKIKTIGDAYMAAGGLPVPRGTNPQDVVNVALEMRDWMLEYKKEKGENGFEIRIGIHTGPVVAGIVGIKKFQYDIWGDTVNTASRMESNGEAGKVNISESTYELVKDQFSCEYRGEIEAKGKGKMKMYFVEQAQQS